VVVASATRIVEDSIKVASDPDVAAYPTAVHADEVEHDTPLSTALLDPEGFGLGEVVHPEPSVFSISVPTPVALPTAVHSVALEQSTPANSPAVESLPSIVHVDPLNVSVSVFASVAAVGTCVLSSNEALEYPTATQEAEDAQDTSFRIEYGTPAAFGVGMTLKDDPLNSSASANSGVGGPGA
jgi:hypothetical protein